MRLSKNFSLEEMTRSMVAARKGIDNTPGAGEIKNLDVTSSGWMILIDRLTEGSLPLPDSFTPLNIVGLDTTIAERGVRIGKPGELKIHIAPTEEWVIRTLKPIHQPLYSG